MELTQFLAKNAENYSAIWRFWELGGESGIRTHGRVSPTHAFQACSIDHSDISPFRINDLRSVWNSLAQNLPSRISDSACPVVPIVCKHAQRDENRNCVRPSNLTRSLTAILLRRWMPPWPTPRNERTD